MHLASDGGTNFQRTGVTAGGNLTRPMGTGTEALLSLPVIIAGVLLLMSQLYI